MPGSASGDIVSPNKLPQVVRSPLIAPYDSTFWNLVKTGKAIRYFEDENGNLWAYASPFILNAYLPYPGGTVSQGGLPIFGLGDNLGGVDGQGQWGAIYTVPVSAVDYPMRFNGATWDRARSLFSSSTTSSANTAQTLVISTYDLHDGLDLIMTTSAGTSTVVVSVSVDGTNYFQVDSIAAAASTVKHYDNATVGSGTYAVSPLSFPYVKIVVGAAGAGDTSTLVVGLK